MKKICVFGASGRTGLQFVEQALSKGYRVLSVVRSQESAMKIPKESEIKIGSAFDGRFINHCIKDCDVIVSLIGHVKNSDPLMQTKITENIISEMQGENVKRLITLTGTGVRKPNDKIPLYDKLGNYIIKKIDPERISDGMEYSEILQESDRKSAHG
jgi:putative NADH-flavin reductase